MKENFACFLGIVILLGFCGSIRSLSTVITQNTDYVLAELVTPDPTVDGTINTDEYGTGNIGKKLTLDNVTGGTNSMNVTVFAARNSTHLFMGLEYSDSTKAITGRDGFMIGFDEDEQEPYGEWVDVKWGHYYSDAVQFFDWYQNMSTDTVAPQDADQNIEGTAVYNAGSSIWTWEMRFPLASGDTAGHDVDLTTNDSVTFMIAVFQETNGPPNFMMFSPYVLAIDNPPPSTPSPTPDFGETVGEPSFTPGGDREVQLNVTFKNTGDLATMGEVPIFWETLGYELALEDGEGILEESVIDFDLNGDNDKTDSYNVIWTHNASRPWDATVDGTYVYALNDYNESWDWPPRTYYINGEPKVFTLGSETHFLYMADSESAQFGLGATGLLKKFPSPNFELLVYSKVQVNDFTINGQPVEENFSTQIVDWTLEYKADLTCYVVPSQAFDIDTGDEVTFSCTITAQEPGTIGVAMIINWSTDSNTRYRWVPVREGNVSFETSTIPTTTPTTTPTTIPPTTSSIPADGTLSSLADTTDTTGEAPSPIITPGFTFITLWLLVLSYVLLAIKRKKRESQI